MARDGWWLTLRCELWDNSRLNISFIIGRSDELEFISVGKVDRRPNGIADGKWCWMWDVSSLRGGVVIVTFFDIFKHEGCSGSVVGY